MKKPIYYWSSIHAYAQIVEKYKHEFELLRSSEIQRARLRIKKMKGFRIMSVDVNYSDRLLFTTVTVDGKIRLVFLEEILKHKYNRSQFLGNKAAMKCFQENASETLEDLPPDIESLFVDHELNPDDFDFNDEVWPVELYNREFIVLNDTQNKAVLVQSPAIISGPPGSGKSCTALSLITKANPDFERVIYLSANPALVREMERNWKALPESTQSKTDRVQFLTVEELMRVLDPDIQSKTLVGEDDFHSWYKSEYSKSKSDDLLSNSILIYQELRIACAYDEKQFSDLGLKQTLSKKSGHQAAIYKILIAWRSHLSKNNKVDLALHLTSIKRLCDMLVIDEAQDLSRLQLKLLLQLTGKEFNVFFCMDSLQCLSDALSPRPYVMALCKQQHLSCNHIELTHSYRVFQKALPLVQTVIAMRNHILGGVADQYEFSRLPIHCDEESALGAVHWIDKLNATQVAQIKALINDTGVVIVTLPEFVAEAQTLFDTQDRVFTPRQIKGLGYPLVIIYRALDNPLFRQCAPLLKEFNPESIDTKTNRAGPGRGHPELVLPFNALFTLMTRASRHLLFIQQSTHALAPIINPLKKLADQGPLVINLQDSHASEHDWHQEAVRQIHYGNLVNAEAIITQRLKKTSTEFRNLCDELLRRPSPACSSSSEPSCSYEPVALPPQPKVARQPKKKKAPSKLAESKAPIAKPVTGKTAVPKKVAALNTFNSSEMEQRLFTTNLDNSSLLIQIITQSNMKVWNHYKDRLAQLPPDSILDMLKIKDDMGFTALMYAEKLGSPLRIDLVKLMEKLDTHQLFKLFSQVSDASYTVFMYGAARKYDFLRLYLPLLNRLNPIQKYKLLKIKDREHETLLMKAIHFGSPSAAGILGMINQLSLPQKIKILSTNATKNGNVFHYACTSKPDIVPALLFMMKGLTPAMAFPPAKQFDILFQQDQYKKTPLLLAAHHHPQLLEHFYKILDTMEPVQRHVLLIHHDSHGSNLLNILMTKTGSYFEDFLKIIGPLGPEIKWLLLSPTLFNGTNLISQAFITSNPYTHELFELLGELTPELRMNLYAHSCDKGINALMYAIRLAPEYAPLILDTICSYEDKELKASIMRDYDDDKQMNALMDSLFCPDSELYIRLCDVLSTLDAEVITRVLAQQSIDHLNALMLAILFKPDSLKLLLPIVAKLSPEQIIVVMNFQDNAPNILLFAIRHRCAYINEILAIVKKLPPDKLTSLLNARDESGQSLLDHAFNLKMDDIANELDAMRLANEDAAPSCSEPSQVVTSSPRFFKRKQSPENAVSVSLPTEISSPQSTRPTQAVSIDLLMGKSPSHAHIFSVLTKNTHLVEQRTLFDLLIVTKDYAQFSTAIKYFKRLSPEQKLKILEQRCTQQCNSFVAIIIANEPHMLKDLIDSLHNVKKNYLKRLFGFQSDQGYNPLMFALIMKDKTAFDLLYPLFLRMENDDRFAILQQVTNPKRESILLMAILLGRESFQQILLLIGLLPPWQQAAIFLLESAEGMTALPTACKLRPELVAPMLTLIAAVPQESRYQILGYSTPKQPAAIYFALLKSHENLPAVLDIVESLTVRQQATLFLLMGINKTNRFTERDSNLLIDAILSNNPCLERIIKMTESLPPLMIKALLSHKATSHQDPFLIDIIRRLNKNTGRVLSLAYHLDIDQRTELFEMLDQFERNVLMVIIDEEPCQTPLLIELMMPLTSAQKLKLLMHRNKDLDTNLLMTAFIRNNPCINLLLDLLYTLKPEDLFELLSATRLDENILQIAINVNNPFTLELLELIQQLEPAMQVAIMQVPGEALFKAFSM